MRPEAPPSKSPHPPGEVEATEAPGPWLVKWDLLCRCVQMESLAQTQQLGIAGLAQARPRKRELQFLKHMVVTVRGCMKGILTSKARKQKWWPKKRFCRMYLHHYFTGGRWSTASGLRMEPSPCSQLPGGPFSKSMVFSSPWG